MFSEVCYNSVVEKNTNTKENTTMKKVKAICIYKDNQVYNLTALFEDTTVTLLQYDLEDSRLTPPHHDTFEELVKDMLGVLKANNMRCGHYKEFNRVWYDIAFIDLNDPTVVSKHSVGIKELEI